MGDRPGRDEVLVLLLLLLRATRVYGWSGLWTTENLRRGN